MKNLIIKLNMLLPTVIFKNKQVQGNGSYKHNCIYTGLQIKSVTFFIEALSIDNVWFPPEISKKITDKSTK